LVPLFNRVLPSQFVTGAAYIGTLSLLVEVGSEPAHLSIARETGT